MKNNDTPTNNIFKVAKNDIFVVREDITAPRFLFFDCGEDKTATAKQNSVLREDKTAPQFFYAYGEDENKDPNLFFFRLWRIQRRNNNGACGAGMLRPQNPMLRQAAHRLRRVLREMAISTQMYRQHNSATANECPALQLCLTLTVY